MRERPGAAGLPTVRALGSMLSDPGRALSGLWGEECSLSVFQRIPLVCGQRNCRGAGVEQGR